MSSPSRLSRVGVARTLLYLCGALFLLGAAIHNPGCVSLAVDAARNAFHRPGIAVPAADRIHAMQWLFVSAGVVFLVLAWAIGRVPALDRCFRRPLVEKLTLVLVVVLTPILWGELALRAFVPPRDATTSLFTRDDALGWKLRPGAIDRWGGVEVQINERGFRGPLVPYERSHARRVLYLGDSVTFGYRIARWQDTFPFLADSLAGARDSVAVETVNLSVEGYSQWQQAIVLETEGARYRPDLVVVGFVLNDVTEMFHLPRFGGAEEGFQMRHAASSSWVDRVLGKSAIVYEVQNLAREMKAKRRLGEDVRLGAIKQQALDVETLMRRPDQANVKTAWDFALADLQKITDRCQASGIKLLVVAFPFAVQLDDPEGLSAPQRVLANYTGARNIAMLDLLPPLSRAAQSDTTALFLDEDHLSLHGHRVVADLIAPAIADQLDN